MPSHFRMTSCAAAFSLLAAPTAFADNNVQLELDEAAHFIEELVLNIYNGEYAGPIMPQSYESHLRNSDGDLVAIGCAHESHRAAIYNGLEGRITFYQDAGIVFTTSDINPSLDASNIAADVRLYCDKGIVSPVLSSPLFRENPTP